VDFRQRAELLTAEQDVGALFDGLVAEVRARL
jgi:hypothetical protein